MGKRNNILGPCVCGNARLWAKGVCSSCYSTVWRSENGRNDRRHSVTCEACGITAKVTKKDARFCSNECYISTRRRQFTTDIELWRQPTISTPGPRWRRSPDRHPSLNGSLFVYGCCGWCGESFMALAGDWERRSIYCSRRCARNAGRARRGRFTVPPQIRRAICERDNWTCQLCSEPVDPEASDLWRATLDHVVPQSHQLVPDHSPGNLQLAHLWCNSVKGDERRYTADDLRVA